MAEPTFTAGQSLLDSQRISVISNGILFKVWDNYRTEKVSQTVSEQGAVWQFQCKWGERFAIAAALVGGGALTGSTTFYQNGFPYPDNPNWLASSVDIKPDAAWKETLYVANPPSLGSPPRALCLCKFTVPPFLTTQQQNTGEQELDFCSNSVPQSATTTSMVWHGTTLPVPADIQLPITYTTIKFTQTLYNRTSLRVPLLASLVDHTNAGTFLGAAPETLLFRGAKSRRKITAKGALNWDVTLSFELNASIAGNGTVSGWNKLWRPKFGWTQFDMVDQTGNHPLFATANFNVFY